MNTISLISNISFNSPEFFEAKIRALASGENRLIDWAHWIIHKPEEDEKKSHIHFVLKPSRRIDTNALRQEFLESPALMLEAKAQKGEPITADDMKPLGVLPFDKTKNIVDWLLYSIHDVRYLLKKGQTRKHHYEKSDVQSTDPDFLQHQWSEAVDPLQAMTARVLELRAQEMTFGEILATGIVPPNMVYYFHTLFYETPDKTGRAGRMGHDEP